MKIRRKPDLHLTEQVRLFNSEQIEFIDTGRGFDISPDGKRLLMIRRIRQPGDEPAIVIVQNWLAGF